MELTGFDYNVNIIKLEGYLLDIVNSNTNSESTTRMSLPDSILQGRRIDDIELRYSRDVTISSGIGTEDDSKPANELFSLKDLKYSDIFTFDTVIDEDEIIINN